MNYLRLFLVISVSLLATCLYSEKVWGQGTLPEPWEEVSKCGEGQILPQDLNIVNNRSNLVQALNRDGICSTRSDIEINDFDTVGEIGISYCDLALGEITPRNPKGDALHGTCCKNTHPNSQKNRSDLCCKEGYYPHLTDIGAADCFDSNDEKDTRPGAVIRSSETPIHTDSETDAAEPLVPGTGPIYTCPTAGCLINTASGDLLVNDTGANPVTSTQASNMTCLPASTRTAPVPNPNNPDQFCLAGEWVTQDELESVDLINVVEQCSQLRDDAQREDCFDCFSKNVNPDGSAKSPQTYVYSSLGCIDTDRDPFITRLFQIGFGTLGGLAVARIMWGAVKRQSTDPAKIQEGRDLILSAIAALVMLAAAFPLLRYIGINLTGLLPISFFN